MGIIEWVAAIITIGGATFGAFKWIQSKRGPKKETNKEICRNVIERMNKEIPNFQQFLERKDFTSDLHQRAVQVDSFALMSKATNELLRIRKFRKSARALLKHLEIKDAEKILRLIESLRPKLEQYCNE